MVLDKNVKYQDIEKIILKAGGRILKRVNLFDVYSDENLDNKGKKSYAVSMIFVDPDKSLRDKDVDKIISKIVQQTRDQLKAELRWFGHSLEKT